MAAFASPRTLMQDLTDEVIVARVLHGEHTLFEILIRRYNQRLYRVARSITQDDSQAEDVMQSAYLHAYEHLAQFSGLAPFSAWLTRIAVNESLHRVRGRKRFAFDQEDNSMDRFPSPAPDPEHAVASAEMRDLLDSAIDTLPDSTRTVFVLRDVDGLSTAETSVALGISEDNVKVRLHRARKSLREHLLSHLRVEIAHAYAFHASRCDRVVDGVLRVLQAQQHSLQEHP